MKTGMLFIAFFCNNITLVTTALVGMFMANGTGGFQFATEIAFPGNLLYQRNYHMARTAPGHILQKA